MTATMRTDIQTATAKAHPNIALIKYWGKSSDARHSDACHNEPAVASLSITLDTLVSETRVQFDHGLGSDDFVLNGVTDTVKLPRISANLDKLRALAGIDTRCRIESSNNFPTGAGLASSASGFAALVAAGNQALQLALHERQQSMLARSMSGSAARSIFGGFAKIALHPNAQVHPQLGRTYAEPIAPAAHWPLEVCVGIVSEKEKTIGSTEGMERSRETSPYYSAWLSGNDTDMDDAEALIHSKDFTKLAELSEFSCLKMHALAIASRPGLLYWTGATVDAMHCIRSLRSRGVPVFFTIDAGPQIKAICGPGYGQHVAEVLSSVTGIQRVIRCGLGGGVTAW